MNQPPTLKDIQKTHQKIRKTINKTPVLNCSSLNEISGAELFFKCENFQKVGAFKFRGACNAVFNLSEQEAQKGVVTHSSGNHAAALALAARMRGINAHIVMPSNAPPVKVAAVKNYGGLITFCEPTLESRETTAERIIGETGATFIHPYNDYRIIAGQGTAALELLDDVEELDVVMAPVGGGGLLSGTAITVKSIHSKIKVIAGEPKNADDAYQSLQAGKIIPPENPNTIADGLKTALGEKTFPIIQKFVDDIITVTEGEIISAMQLIFERMKIIIEPSSAVPFAALLAQRKSLNGKRIGIILSGGNVDFSSFFKLLKERIQ